MPGKQRTEQEKDQETEQRTGAVGPVQTPAEAGHPDYLGPPLTTVVASAGRSAFERRFLAWWRGRSVRRRRLDLVVAAAVTVGLLWGGALLVRPAPPPPTPVPFPAQVTDIRYAGLEGTGIDTVRFTVLLTVTNTSTESMTLDLVAQPYRGVDVTTAQLLPLNLFPGRPQPLWVEMTVRNCSLTPRADLLPFLDVTLSNARAIQTQSEILGAAYSRDLHAAILKACPPSPSRSGQSPAPSIPAGR